MEGINIFYSDVSCVCIVFLILFDEYCALVAMFRADLTPEALAKSISWLYLIRLARGVLFEF